MTRDDLIQLARDCREAQRTYFRERDGDSLTKAKDLERRLDTALAEWDNGQQTVLTGDTL